MEKIEVKVKVIYIHKYTSYFGYSSTNKRIYIMKDDFGRTYKWDTSSRLKQNSSFTRQGDVIKISGSIKGHSEYKGQPQTELVRVKLLETLERVQTKEERDAQKKAEQIASLKDGDFIWEMPYRQYKAHYADCETLAGSYRNNIGTYNNTGEYAPAMICVIIRDGRLKASGTRGQHYSGYVMENEEGLKVTYKAVSEENAYRRASQEFPEHSWECVKIYDYNR